MLHVSGRLHKLSFLRYECSLNPQASDRRRKRRRKSEQRGFRCADDHGAGERRYRIVDGGRHCHGARCLWLLHELVWAAERRGIWYHLLAIGLAVAVLVRGAGSFSMMACSARVWRGDKKEMSIS